MTDSTTSGQKPFVKEFLAGILPQEFVRTLFLFLFRPRPFANQVKANDWDGKSHPLAFLVASLYIVALLNPFIGRYSTDPDWYGSATKMDDERFLEFKEAFQFTDQELQTIDDEILFLKGRTAASRRIEKTVGSLKVSEIVRHLEKANPKLARALEQEADGIKKYNKYYGYLIAPVFYLACAIGLLILHPILRQASQPYRLAFYLLIYFEGFWLMFSNLIISFGQFAIPDERSWLSSLFVFFEGLAAVAFNIHGCWVCGLVYNRGILRRLLAFVLAHVAVLVMLFVFSIVLGLVVDYLP